ncbi:hypothetical protein Tco_1198978 [Tanacetum coccineum]
MEHLKASYVIRFALNYAGQISTPTTFEASVDTDVEKLLLKRLSRNPSISTPSKPTPENKNKKDSYVVEDSDAEASDSVGEKPRKDKDGGTPD